MRNLFEAMLRRKAGGVRPVGLSRSFPRVILALALRAFAARGAETIAATDFHKDVQPLLNRYCSDCHEDGEKKGDVSFDEFKSDAALTGDHDLWLKVIKNLRAGLMPPGKKPHPTPEELKRVEAW